jgi:hypothetical protein
LNDNKGNAISPVFGTRGNIHLIPRPHVAETLGLSRGMESVIPHFEARLRQCADLSRSAPTSDFLWWSQNCKSPLQRTHRRQQESGKTYLEYKYGVPRLGSIGYVPMQCANTKASWLPIMIWRALKNGTRSVLGEEWKLIAPVLDARYGRMWPCGFCRRQFYPPWYCYH